MGAREEAIEEMVERLKKILTLEDFKEAHDEIITLMENVLKAALTVLKDFLANMVSMDPEKMQEQASMFQEKSFIFSDEIEKELERINAIPGAEEFSAGFDSEMQKRLDPLMEQVGKEMSTLMEKLMGGIMGGLADAFGSGDDE